MADLSKTDQEHHAPMAAMRGVTAEDGSSKARFERAALTLFAQTSIEHVTTKQIAKAAGLSEGLLYRHAKSKNDLAADMFFAIHARLAELIRTIGIQNKSIDQKAADVVMAYTRCADDDWVLFSYHLLNTHRFLRDDRSSDNPVAATEGILQDAMDRGEIPHSNVILTAGMVLGTVLQPALHKAFGRLDGPLLQYAPEMTQAILSILHGPPQVAPSTASQGEDL